MIPMLPSDLAVSILAGFVVGAAFVLLLWIITSKSRAADYAGLILLGLIAIVSIAAVVWAIISLIVGVA